MKTTTTRLHLDRRTRLSYWWHSRGERTTRDALWGAALCVFVLLIHSLLKPVEQPLTPIVQQPAVMVIATAAPLPPLPTLTPWSTPAPVIVEVPVYQEPVYVEVPVYQEPVYVEVYTPPTAEPLMPTLAPQQQVLLDRQQWAEDAQRQRNIQEHYVEPPQAGGSGKMPAPDIGSVPASGAAEWCAAAAAANAGARCVEGP